MKKSDKKTEKKQKTPKKHEPMSPEMKLALKVVLLFVIFGAVLCGLFMSAKYIYNVVCKENSNYILRNIEVTSNGYWNGKNRIVGMYLGILPNPKNKNSMRHVNIFSIDLENLRYKAQELPGIKSCEIRRILPDTLTLNLIERVPRCRISRYNNLLADEDGVLLSKTFCLTNTSNLPLITGIPAGKKLVAGQKMVELANAMQIVMMTLRYYSDIEITAVDVRDKEFLKFYVRYGSKGRIQQAIMPNDLEGIDIRLKALRTALIRSYNANDNVSIYNLSFDGRIICE